MQLSLDKDDLKDYITKQVNNYFPDKFLIKTSDVDKILTNSLNRTEYCFSHIKLKYYNYDGNTRFNHLNSEHYGMFLWFLSNEAYLKNNINLAEKLFYLNKSLNGLDAFYSIKLPDIFLLHHPVGSVIGNAHYENYLTVYQNVTIGSSKEGIYPILSKGVSLMSKASIIGNCKIGKNVTLAAGAAVVNEDVPDDTLVFGQSRNLVFKKEKMPEKERIYNELRE